MNKRYKLISLVTSAAMTMSLMAPVVLAADVPDNPAGTSVEVSNSDDEMQVNNGTVTNNAGIIHNNHGIVENNGGTVVYNKGTVKNNTKSVYDNAGTVESNEDSIYKNHGTVESNTGTVEYNLGGTVNNSGTGIVVHNMPHIISIKDNNGNTDGLVLSSDNPDDFFDEINKFYAKDGVFVTLKAADGYMIVGEVSTKNGSITDNGDGTYTIENIGSDDEITLTLAVSADAVKVVADAYRKLDAALAGSDMDALTFAFRHDFYLAENIFNQLTQDQLNELGLEFGKSGNEIYSEISADSLKAEAILEVSDRQQAFKDKIAEDNAAEYAQAYVDYYDSIVYNESYAGTLEYVQKFIPDAEQSYKDAKSLLQHGENISKVANAYKALSDALEGDDFEKLKAAVDGFNNVLDIYNSLDTEDMDLVGSKLNMSGKEIISDIESKWEAANIIFEIYHKSEDFIDHMTTDEAASYAKAFVDYYDSIAADKNNADILKDVDKFLPKTQEAYYQAQLTMEGSGDSNVNDGTGNTDGTLSGTGTESDSVTGGSGASDTLSPIATDSSDKSPKTGDMDAVTLIKSVF